MRYIALIRGVTPSGKNRVPMAELRERLTAVGFAQVATYIQSGNVLLESELPPDAIERQIHELIKANFGGNLTIVVRTPDQLRAAFEGYPFPGVDPTKQYFAFLHQRPDPSRVEALAEWDIGADQLAVVGETAYLALATRVSESKATNSALERRLGVRATTRNYNTTRALVARSNEGD